MDQLAKRTPAPRGNEYRDAWCGQVLADRVGSRATVAGWVHRRRDHGGLIFIDLRDRTGLLQLVFDPDESAENHALAHQLRAEDVLSAEGEVVKRSPETVNPEIATGEVELRVAATAKLADAETPPFEIESYSGEVGEELRLRHRYLDMRRPPMQRAMAMRAEVCRAMRAFLDAEGFLEIETPLLSRSTPEGARDFLVPARREPGSFYALPQSPQLFKQMLMIGGFERYYQIARCFRDEDQRADRQLDFTQLDIELAFVTVDDVIDLNERMLAGVLEAVGGPAVDLPLPRIPYDEALRRYGTDRPDVRFGLELSDLTGFLEASEFRVFAGAISSGGVVRGFNAGPAELARSALDGLIERAQELGAKGLVWAFCEGDGWRSPTAKFLSDTELSSINEALGAEEGDLLLLVADAEPVANAVLAQLRLDLAAELGLVDPGAHAFVWVTDWPMFGWNADEQRWDPLHHPFTAPDGEFDSANPGDARALAYDLVWNGQELGGGSIRISDPALQAEVLAAIGIDAEEAGERFGFLLEALKYGAPPHGGIAYGLDRFIQRLLDTESIRDVIAFPKTASGADPLTGAPAPVDSHQLAELGIKVPARREG